MDTIRWSRIVTVPRTTELTPTDVRRVRLVW